MARRSDERDAARAEYIARMEKDGEVNLRQLADDLHLKYDTVRRWKAKDGWDPPASRKPGGQPGNKMPRETPAVVPRWEMRMQ